MTLRVCLVALNAWPAVNPEAGRQVGGMETNTWTVACGVAAEESIAVTLIVRRSLLAAEMSINNVQIIPLIERLRAVRNLVSRAAEVTDQFPWVRLRRWNAHLLWALPLLALVRPFHRHHSPLRRLRECVQAANADVYVAFGNGRDTAAVMQFAAELGRPGVVWLQANTDVEDSVFSKKDALNEYGEKAADHRKAFEFASAVISQTQWQHDQVMKHSTCRSVVIPNPIDLAVWGGRERDLLSGSFVLWVGRFDRFHKRPHLCLDIARACPEISFRLVINRGDPDVESEIRSSCPRNVELIDYVPRDRMPQLFREAKLFLSTGAREFEGFPNVLLEAAASGTPIVSLDDFDGFLERSSAGYCGQSDMSNTTAHVQELWQNRNVWGACSQAGSHYVEQHHSVHAVAVLVRNFLVSHVEGFHAPKRRSSRTCAD